MAARRPTAVLATALTVAIVALLTATATASAALPAAPCGPSGFLCGQLAAPLDRAGGLGGAVSLSFSILPAGTAPASEAVVGLAGGPGQAALPLAPTFAEALEPLRRTRDLLVFDQRGVGESGPLSCSVSGWPRRASSAAACARQLGPARSRYRSVDTAQDIEALRVAGGYERLVLYGVSYGTKVALAYAALHPDRVAALVLDSVVPLDGPDPFARRAFRATGRVLRELCAARACAKATGNVTRDLRRTVQKLERRPLRGSVTAPSGRRLRVQLGAAALWGVLLAGDLNPALRAELPGAMRAMLRGDRTPILRLSARADGLNGTAVARSGRLQSSPDEFNETLFAATRCEETPFPWKRTSGPSGRRKQLNAAAKRVPRASLHPFGRGVALASGVFDLCIAWPVSAASPLPGALPQVPTLVLNGSADLRTSAEQARYAVASIPGARIAIVANTGHSVLGSDLGDCAAREIAAFASGTAATCEPAANLFKPTPAPPKSLAAVSGRSKNARTVTAVLATLADVRRQLIGDAIAAQRPVTVGSRTGGLRGGVAIVEGRFATLREVSYVPGVTVSGNFAFGAGTTQVRVRGSRAARGSLSIDEQGRVTGTLSGRRVSVIASAASARTRTVWPEPRFPHTALRLP